jgi:hypothetical protein
VKRKSCVRLRVRLSVLNSGSSNCAGRRRGNGPALVRGRRAWGISHVEEPVEPVSAPETSPLAPVERVAMLLEQLFIAQPAKMTETTHTEERWRVARIWADVETWHILQIWGGDRDVLEGLKRHNFTFYRPMERVVVPC